MSFGLDCEKSLVFRFKFKMKLFLLTAAFLATSVLAQAAQAEESPELIETGNTEIYQNLVLGVGPGTFAVIVAAMIGVVICFFKECVATPNLCVLGAISLPVMVFIVVRMMPVKSVNSDEEKTDDLPTDSYLIRTIGICVAIFVVAVALFITVFCSNFTTSLVAQKIDS
jgi:hypothetical protein